jgi:glycosyltransferase involved in cell wall biosynthesis
MPLISIIIPVYNIEQYISECIESVLAQTCADFELILVNDGSTDSSGKICRVYALSDERVIVINKRNGGVSSARNAGIENSCGKYLWFVDGDDWIAPESVEKLSAKIRETDSDMINFNMKVVNDSKINDPKLKISNYNLMNFEFNDFYRNYYLKYLLGFGPCTKLFKGKIVRERGVRFDESESMGEDQIFNVEYYMHIKNFCYIPDSLYYYRKRQNSATTAPADDRYTYHFHLFEKKYNIIKNSSDDYINSELFIMHIMCGFEQAPKMLGYWPKGRYRRFLHECMMKYHKEYDFDKQEFIKALNHFFEIEKIQFFRRLKLRLLFMCLLRMGK